MIFIKKTFLSFFLLSALVRLNAQQTEGVTHSGHRTGQNPFPVNTYTELQNPVETNLNDWKNVRGTNVSWASTDIRYKKEVPPSVNKQKKISLIRK